MCFSVIWLPPSSAVSAGASGTGRRPQFCGWDSKPLRPKIRDMICLCCTEPMPTSLGASSDAPWSVGLHNVQHRPMHHAEQTDALRRKKLFSMLILSTENISVVLSLSFQGKQAFLIHWLPDATWNKPISCSWWTQVPQKQKKAVRTRPNAKSLDTFFV